MPFKGTYYTTAGNWTTQIPLAEFQDKPIKYLEIGVLYGCNLLSVCNTYAKHPQSQVFALDPWEDYPDYQEYQDQLPSIYNTFLENIQSSSFKNKISVVRGYSHLEVPKFQDHFFDIIYIDANHEPEYVLEDAVVAFRKLKIGGYLIFDDYGWGGPDMTKRGIDSFVDGYFKRITVVCQPGSQLIIKKTR